jgi:hypothetical protein
MYSNYSPLWGQCYLIRVKWTLIRSGLTFWHSSQKTSEAQTCNLGSPNAGVMITHLKQQAETISGRATTSNHSRQPRSPILCSLCYVPRYFVPEPSHIEETSLMPRRSRCTQSIKLLKDVPPSTVTQALSTRVINLTGIANTS